MNCDTYLVFEFTFMEAREQSAGAGSPPPTVWLPGIQLRSLDLAASALIY